MTILIIVFSGFFLHAQCGNTEYYQFQHGGIFTDLTKNNSDLLIPITNDNNNTMLIKFDVVQQQMDSLLMGNVSSDFAKLYGLSINEDNDYYLAGSFRNYVNLGNGVSYTATGVSSSAFIAKLDSNFNHIWSYRSTSPSNTSGDSDAFSSIATDTLGGVYFAGALSNHFEFQGVNYSTYNPDSSHYVGKINQNTGLLDWIRFQGEGGGINLETSNKGGFFEWFNLTNYYTYTDNLGNVYSNGQTTSSLNSSVILYYDSLGNQQWGMQIQSGVSILNSDTDLDGNLVLIGEFGDTLLIAGDTLVNLNKKSLFFVRIDHLGHVKDYDRILTSDYYNLLDGVDINCLDDGGFLICGSTLESVNINGIICDVTNYMGENSFFAARLDSTKTPVWAKSFGAGNNIHSNAIQNLNNCSAFFAGFAYNEFEYDTIHAVVSTGFFPFLIELDLETGELANVLTNSDDPFGPNGVSGSSSADIYQLDETSFEIYPNPVDNVLHIKSALLTNLNWTLYDQFGKVISTGNFIDSSEINFSSYDKGIYNLMLTDGNNLVYYRLIK